jgi:hypothetical protein
MIRALTALVVLVVVAGTVALLDPTPEPMPQRTAATFEVLAADLPAACPGWLQLPVGEEDSGDGTLAPGSTDVHRDINVSGVDGPVPVGSAFSTASDLATSIERVGGGDLSGLAAATCVEPRVDTWLVGGATQVGQSSRLVLVNPTSVESDVVATLFGPNGAIDQQVIRSLGAESSESILLEGVASGLATLVVHVEASGAGVVAMMQDSRLNGFLPAGSEWVTPSPTPSTNLVIPGVGPSDPGGDDGVATVRLMAPDGAIVNLRLANASGSDTWPGSRAIQLDPGVVADFDIPETGIASVIVEADQPVVAAAYSRRSWTPEEGLEGERAFDTVWVSAQGPDTGPALVVVPPYSVSLVAYAQDLTTLTVLDESTGMPFGVYVIGEGTTMEIPLEVPAGTVLGVNGKVSWVLRVTDGDFVTSIHPVSIEDFPASFSVRPGSYVP